MAQKEKPPEYFSWSRYSSLPDKEGYAGAYAGVSNGVFLFAGGSNFPNGTKPWNGQAKSWNNKIFALENPEADWKEVGKLPFASGYGVSLTYEEAVFFIGGSDGQKNHTGVYKVTYKDGTIVQEVFPSLPFPLSNSCGVIVRDTLYLLGGQVEPDGMGSNHFISISLKQPATGWNKLVDLPGRTRMLSISGTINDDIYLFGGVHITKEPETDSVSRTYLQDAWKFNTSAGWERISDLPNKLAAAPGPAYPAGQSHLLIFGGDDGSNAGNVFTLRDKHPGFRSDIFAYNSITNSWSVIGNIPIDIKADADLNPASSTYAPVTTPLVVWHKNIVIAGGEARPAVRSNKMLVASPIQPSGNFGLIDWMVVGLYFLAVVGISIYVSRKMGNTTADFFLGGQSIPWWAAGLSIFGSKLSALTFIAIPAKAYATDWVYLINNLMILLVAPIVSIYYLPYFRKLNITSVYEYLQIRFNSTVKLLGSATFVIFQLSRLGVVIYLPALVLSTVTGINIFACIFITTVITTAYSIAGGIEAVVWTEVMQVFVLLGGAFASILYIIFSNQGGFTSLLNTASEHQKLRIADLNWAITEPVLWVVILGGFLTNLVTYTSDQVVVQRYLTTKTEAEARKSIYTNAIMVVPASLLFFGVGTSLWVFFKEQPQLLNPHSRTDDVFPWFISQFLPEGLSGLVIAGLFAATMSTISSSMNSIATVVTTDFYAPVRKTITDKQKLRFAKCITLLLGVIGSLIACYFVYLKNASIWDQYIKIIGLFGGCLAGIFLAGIFFKRISSNGIVAGFFFSCILLFFIQQYTSINFFLYPFFAIAACVGSSLLFTKILPTKN